MNKSRPNIALGLVVIAAGIVLLLNNLGVARINVLPYWPVIIMAWGGHLLVTGSQSAGSRLISALIILTGAVLLGRNLGLFHLDLRAFFRILWPLLLIAVGFSIFLGRSFSGKANLAFLGGVERGKDSAWELDNSSYLAFMGGIDLDLRNAVLPEGETVMDLTAIMGGIEVKVPSYLPVICDGFAVLGGVEFFGIGSGGIFGSTRNEQAGQAGNARVLKVQARALMGGVEIKSV